MAGEWTTYRLEELCEFTNGFAFKSTDYVPRSDKTLEVLRMGYIQRGGGFKEDDSPVFVPKAYGRDLSRFLLQPGDIAIAMTDMKDRVAILANTAWIREANRFVLNQRVGCIRVKRNDLLDARFFYFYCNWQPHIDFLRSRANSGVQVNLSTSAIKEAELFIPPIAEQESIAHILGTLDTKIELNRRMNETLEAIALALFKSWFVDFDPVRAKAEGRDSGPPRHLADLFPDSFEDSELGEIPRGWVARPIGEGITLSREAIDPGDYPAESFDLFSIPAYDEGQVPAKDLGSTIKSNKLVVVDGCVLVSKLNPKTPRVWLPPSAKSKRQVASTEFLVCIANDKKPFSREFIYCLAKSEPVLEHLTTHASGTSNSHQRVRPQDFLNFQIASAPDEILKSFSAVVHPLFEQIASLRDQSITLGSLRETLLPKLISGEVRIKSVENIAEDA